MSYCQCGGYLGSGGIDGYSGRWCRCANPKVSRDYILTTDKITITPEVQEQMDMFKVTHPEIKMLERLEKIEKDIADLKKLIEEIRNEVNK